MSRLVPIAASVAIHVIILVGTALVIAGAAAPHGQVIFLELTEAASPPVTAAPPVAPPPRLASAPRTVPSPPRPELATAAPIRPVVPEPAAPQVGATLPEAPPALATVPAPTPSVPPTASAPHASTAPTPRGEAAPAAETRAPARSTPPMVAALPRDGITQRAIPRASYQYRPDYPASAWRRGIGGTTLLAVLVADDGRVAEIVIKESAGDPELDRAAADAVRRWRFEPARRGTEPVAMWVELPVKFQIP